MGCHGNTAVGGFDSSFIFSGANGGFGYPDPTPSGLQGLGQEVPQLLPGEVGTGGRAAVLRSARLAAHEPRQQNAYEYLLRYHLWQQEGWPVNLWST